MKKLIFFILISILILQLGCKNQDKWKAVPLKLKKQESYNYSEMISGELDSTQKSELEEVKRITTRQMDDNPAQLNKNESNNTSSTDTIWHGINKIYNWFLDLF